MPDAPLNLQNVPTITSATQIGLLWEEGPENGGSTVIDYTIDYDQSNGDWTELVNSLIDKEYTTLIDLIEGNTYTFKVKARNTVGFGLYSLTTSILVAQRPNKPIL